MKRNFCEYCGISFHPIYDDNTTDLDDIVYCKPCVKKEFERISNAIGSMSIDQDKHEFWTNQDEAEKGLMKLGRVLDLI